MSRRTDNGRRFRLLALIGTLVFALVVTLPLSAQGSTLLNDDFQDGNATGWTTSGGNWSVVSDGTLAYRQSSTSGNARALAGSTSWTDQSVQARIKPITFAGGSEFVAVLARVQNSSNFYYATLRNANKIEIKKTVSGSAKVLATADFTVNTNTWYTLRLEAQGTTLRAFVNGTQYLSVSDSQFASGQAGLATYNGSASFDDVLVTGAGSPVTPTPITPTAVTSTPVTSTPVTSTPATPTATQPPCPTPGLVGFATVNALGQNGTTGGAGGPVVTVSTASELLDYLARSGPYVIQVQGTIALPGPMHNVASDKTIIGLGSNAGITGGGFNIGLPLDNALTSPPANAVKNIIIRNLRFSGYADDAINVQMFSHHVWIDHNTFAPGTDGALDVKRGSDYVTISWNHFDGTDKNSLVGHDDNNGAQDIGRLRVTYHHNWFDATTQRNPRVRFAELVHVYNNYYNDLGDYGVASAMNAGVLLESNYFKNSEDTALAFKYGTGRLVARNNVLDVADPPETNGSVPEASSYYAYTQDNPNNIPSIVQNGAGVGKLSSGGTGCTATPTPSTPTPVTPTATPVTVTPVTPTPVTPTATPGGVSFALVGYGAGTTGGAGGSTVTVNTLSALKSAAASSSPMIIQVNGTISGNDSVAISSNKTIVGVGTSGKLIGIELNIDEGVSNVIIRNLSISKVVASRDNIHIQGPNVHHIWIDHNELSSDTTHDKDYYDGALDMSHDVDNVTVSWNVFRDHYKTSLIGHSDSNASEDTGSFHVTYHHNYFYNVSSRAPSIRFGTLHSYNNLFESFIDANTGISSRMGACARIENNVFSGVLNPVLTTQSGTGSKAGGVQLIGNNFGGGAVESSPTCSLTPPYSYSAENASTVPATVKANAGIGKIN